MFSVSRLPSILLLAVVIAAAPLAAWARDVGSLARVASVESHEAPLRIVAFGSSSTEGIGASSPAAAYPAQLARELSTRLPTGKVIVLNRGIGGEDADDMVRRLPAVLAEQPDLVIWQTGSNDPLRDVPLDRFIEDTRSGIATMRAAGIDVMLMEPQECRKLAAITGSDRFRDAVRAIGADMGVPVIRRFDLMRSWVERGLVTPARLMSGDGLHMADAGYALLAADVARQIVALAKVPARIGTAAR